MSDETAMPPEATPEQEAEEPGGAAVGRGAKRIRRKRVFPNISFEEALFFANAIQKHASGRRLGGSRFWMP